MSEQVADAEMLDVPLGGYDMYWRKQQQKFRHKCPPWCHKCPILGGDLMPECWGVVIRQDLDACTCERRSKINMHEELVWLRKRIAEIEKLMGKMQGERK